MLNQEKTHVFYFAVPVLACQDRLLRVLKDSSCAFEVEVCGIPAIVHLLPEHLIQNDSLPIDPSQEPSQDVHLVYGTMDGKVSLVTFQFVDRNQLEPVHKWEIPVDGSVRQQINCLAFSPIAHEFFVGRSDGNIEFWRLPESLNAEGLQRVDLQSPPELINTYQCGESITNLLPLAKSSSVANSSASTFGLLKSNAKSVAKTPANKELDTILCSTFTGLVFGLCYRAQAAQRQVNPNYLMVSQENAAKIDELRAECDALEARLVVQKGQYERQTSGNGMTNGGNEMIGSEELSALPFFEMNDSFTLHNGEHLGDLGTNC